MTRTGERRKKEDMMVASQGWSAAQNHCDAMYLPQPLLEMQKLKASDVESLSKIVPG